MEAVGAWIIAAAATVLIGAGIYVVILRRRLERAHDREEDLRGLLDGKDRAVHEAGDKTAAVRESLAGMLAQLAGVDRDTIMGRGLSLTQLLDDIAHHVHQARRVLDARRAAAAIEEPDTNGTEPAITTEPSDEDIIGALDAAHKDLAAILELPAPAADGGLIETLRLTTGVQGLNDIRAVFSARDWRTDPALVRERLIRPEIMAGVDAVLRADLIISTYRAEDPDLARHATALRFAAAVLDRTFGCVELRFSKHRLLADMSSEIVDDADAGPRFAAESDVMRLPWLAAQMRHMLHQEGNASRGAGLRLVDVQSFGVTGPHGQLRRPAVVAIGNMSGRS